MEKIELELNKRIDLGLQSYIVRQTGIKLSRSFIGATLPSYVRVSGKVVASSYKVKSGDIVQLDLDGILLKWQSRSHDGSLIEIVGEKGDLDIVEECESYIVISKPKGLVVHPSAEHRSGTLANIVKGYLLSKGEWDPAIDRAGIVHRLDKDVSGLMIVAKQCETQQILTRLFAKNNVLKIYEVKVNKNASSEFTKLIEEQVSQVENSEMLIKELVAEANSTAYPVGSKLQWIKVGGRIARDRKNRRIMKFTPGEDHGRGRVALSYILPISNDRFFIAIKSGRKHQIRATLKAIGYQIVGDTLYGQISSGRAGIELRSVLLGLELDGMFRRWLLM